MSNRALLWAFTFVWLLGPIEPVFAFDRDIAGQFPDVRNGAAGGNVWAVETTRQFQQAPRQFGGNAIAPGGGDWVVETWSRGRRRDKHFRGDNNNINSFNNGDPGFGGPGSYQPAANYGGNPSFPDGNNSAAASFQNGNRFAGDNGFQGGRRFNDAGNAPPTLSSSAQYQGRPDSFAGRNIAAANNLINGIDPNAPRKPDKFADSPQIDGNGIRHFGNGRHYDLSAMPIEQALNVVQDSDAQLQQQQQMDKARQREKARQRFNQFNRFDRF
jgi:hypothetical protein